MRQTYLQAVVNDLEELLAQFEWDEIFLTTETRVLATQFIAEFNLGSHDAIHLATATLAGVLDFASLDEGSDG